MKRNTKPPPLVILQAQVLPIAILPRGPELLIDQPRRVVLLLGLEALPQAEEAAAAAPVLLQSRPEDLLRLRRVPAREEHGAQRFADRANPVRRLPVIQPVLHAHGPAEQLDRLVPLV